MSNSGECHGSNLAPKRKATFVFPWLKASPKFRKFGED